MGEVIGSSWYIPRPLMRPYENDFETHRLFLTYNIAYGGPVTITDSDFVTDMNLRLAIRRSDGYARDLVQSGLLRFAFRKKNNAVLPLAETAHDLHTRRAITPDVDVEGAAEYEFIERNGQIRPYDLSFAAGRFRKELFRIIQDQAFSKKGIPQYVLDKIVELLRRRERDGASIDKGLFYPGGDFYGDIDRALDTSDANERYATLLHELATGIHSTFLPDTLGLNGAYSLEIQPSVALYRGEYKMEPAEVERRRLKVRGLDLSDTVAGLKLLRATDLEALLGSYAEYEAVRDPSAALTKLVKHRDSINELICRRYLTKAKTEGQHIDAELGYFDDDEGISTAKIAGSVLRTTVVSAAGAQLDQFSGGMVSYFLNLILDMASKVREERAALAAAKERSLADRTRQALIREALATEGVVEAETDFNLAGGRDVFSKVAD